MSHKYQLKVGDKIVDFGQVYRIYKIKKDRNLEGVKEDHIYYKPYFKSEKNRSLVCSIPKSNTEEANLRRPVSKKKIKKTLKLLSKKPNSETKINVMKADTYLKENDPLETARLLRLLWLEKQEKEKELSTRKKTIYQDAMRQLAEEVAVVQNVGLKKARKKILRRLKKVYPQKKEKNGKQY